MEKGGSERVRWALAMVAIVAVSAVVGVGLAARPVGAGVALLSAVVVALVVVPMLLWRPQRELLLATVVFLNYENLLRYTQIDEPLGGVFQLARIPIVVLVGLALLGLRGTALLHGAGKASSQFILLYLLWATVSALACPDPSNALFHVIALALLVIILALTVSAFEDPTEFWRGWLASLVFGLAVVILVSIVLVVFGFDMARADRMVLGAVGTGFRGLMTGPNDLAQVACLGLGATLGLAELGGRGRNSWWFMPMVVLCCVAGLVSGARSGLLGILSGLGYVLAAALFERRGIGQVRRRQLLVGGIGLAVVVVGLLSSEVGRTQIGRMSETAVSATGSQAEVRPIVWGTYLRSVVRRPVFGVGYGNYATIDEPYTVRLVGAHASHMALMEYTITTGLPGTVLFCLALLVAWRGAHAPGAGPFRRSVVLFWAAAWPIFLLSMGAAGLAQVSGWAFWVPIVCAGAFLAAPTPTLPIRPDPAPQMVPHP